MIDFGPITQLGYLTDNIDNTAKMWTDIGIGPWTRMNSVTMPATVDGQAAEIKIDLALSYMGDIQMELIKPLCDSPSPYKRNKKIGLWGLHHTQFTVDDIDVAISKCEVSGMMLGCEINSGGSRYIYMRGDAGWIELTTLNPGLQMMFDMIRTSVAEWDGVSVFHQLG